jgi:tetratricopeptide (TPR) repeat protein
MGYRSRKVFALFGVLLFVLLSSCGAARREVVNFAIQQAELGFTGGDFQRAIDLYKGAYQKYPKDSVLLVNYIKTLEQIKSQGEKAEAREDFALAGSTYDILLRNYPHFTDFAYSLSFNADFLETKIKTSRNLLIEMEAQPYLKKGDFQKAIDVYQGAYQRYLHESMLRDNYLQSLEAIKKNADQAFERKDFALAGKVYEILWRNYPHFSDLAPSLSFNDKFLEERMQTSRKLLAEKEAHLHLTAGDFQKTIEIYKEIYQQNSQDSMLRMSYTKALEAIKKKADHAFARKNFAMAGRIYEILWRNYSHFTDLNPSLSWSKEFLNNRMQKCKTFLYKKALAQYRSGNLSDATAIWKSILEFDPENAEIIRAVDTATIQLRNLEKLK